MEERIDNQLLDGLLKCYVLSELQELCFRLNIEVDDLRREKKLLAIDIIVHMRNRGRIGTLLYQVKSDRPHYLYWPESGSAYRATSQSTTSKPRITLSNLVQELLEWKLAHHSVQEYWLSLSSIHRDVEYLLDKPSEELTNNIKNRWNISCKNREKALKDSLASITIIKPGEELSSLRSVLLEDFELGLPHWIHNAKHTDDESVRNLYWSHQQLMELLASALHIADLNIIRCADMIGKLVDTDVP